MGSAVLKPFEHVYNKDRHIFEAIRKNKFPLAKKLILSGTDVDCINEIGATPLIENCRAPDISKNRINRQEFAKFLIENGCNIQKYDIHGWKAVLYAEENGHSSIAKMLNRRESKTSCYKKRGKQVFFHY